MTFKIVSRLRIILVQIRNELVHIPRYLFLIMLPAPLCVITILAQDVYDIGRVQSKGALITTFAMPELDPQNGSDIAEKGFLRDTILNDLELSGYFRRVKERLFIAQNHARDKRLGRIDFAEWKALNAFFLLKGEYYIKNNIVNVDCILYDVQSGTRIYGRAFKKYPLTAHRKLAHTIANEIFNQLGLGPGIALTKIAFVSDRTGRDELYVMDWDGANQRRLTKDTSLVTTPCWGANGTEIYYTSYKKYNPDLYGIQLDTGKTWWISYTAGLNVSAAWSERQKRIVLTLGKDGNSEVYTMDRNGNNPRRLTYSNHTIESAPSWSPEGNRILYTSDRTGTQQIYVMDADGFNNHRLTHQGSYNDLAVWSPKGDRITFSGRTSDRLFKIFTMDIDGTNWHQLTGTSNTVYKGFEGDQEPTWAPDGQHIAFSSDRTGSWQIYSMNADGSNLVQLTAQGSNRSPVWSPLLE